MAALDGHPVKSSGGIIEAVFTSATACHDGRHVCLPSRPICECGYVTLSAAPHAPQPIEFKIEKA